MNMYKIKTKNAQDVMSKVPAPENCEAYGSD